MFARKKKPKNQYDFQEATVIEVGENRSYLIETRMGDEKCCTRGICDPGDGTLEQKKAVWKQGMKK